MSRPKDWRLDVVKAVNFYQQMSARIAHATMADALLETMGYPAKQAYRMLEDAAEEGLIDYGVSARTAWLTDKGRRLLLSGKLDGAP